MKEKEKANMTNAVVTSKMDKNEIEYLNDIDSLTVTEFVEGENFLQTQGEIDHNGVELLVNGSDLEHFPDKDEQDISSSGEPGEIQSSEDEENETH